MKEHLRNKLFEESIRFLTEKHPDFPESKARKLGSYVAETSIQVLIENNKNLQEQQKDMLLEAERTKKMFRDHIENLQKTTKDLMKVFKEQGMVKVNWDPKQKRNVMVAKTSVLANTVQFLNNLNTLVIDFYKVVYKVDESNNEDRAQINLF